MDGADRFYEHRIKYSVADPKEDPNLEVLDLQFAIGVTLVPKVERQGTA